MPPLSKKPKVPKYKPLGPMGTPAQKAAYYKSVATAKKNAAKRPSKAQITRKKGK